jgi:signal transduction histidine kinase
VDAAIAGQGENDGLAAAARVLLAQQLVAVAWLDPDLIVRECHGPLGAFIVCDKPAANSIPVLFGLDQQILALKRQPERRLDIPNFAVVGPSGPGPRLNLHLTWDGWRQQFLLALAQATSQAELEAELIDQSRRRQLLEAKQLEQAQEIARTNAELTRANRDLAEFADIMAHDLKAPLRGIRFFAEDLEATLTSGDTAEAQGLIERLKAQSRRMTRMLTDLLEYARAGRKHEAIAAVDTFALVKSIVASLPMRDGLTCHIEGQWPTVQSLEAPLDLILRNLIDNAIKCHDRETGEVRLTAGLADNALTIWVADDGPGILPAHHELVFQPFRSLQKSAAGTAGSGMGLALVRRTAEAVGASVELKSQPDRARGATFIVHWPIAPTS